VPEGDTVYRAARKLDRALTGHVLEASDFRVPQLATVDLSGARVTGTFSRGKHLLTHIEHDDAWTLHTHLKMEGTWRLVDPGARWPRPASQARVVLSTDRATAVGFSLGVVELISTDAEQEVVGHLGPDLLGPDWDADEALRRLLMDPGRQVRAALLDQRNLAGIGNMYAAEVCFVTGTHPTTPVGEVRDLRRMVLRARQMLDLNKERAVQSTTGNLRDRERMWVYRRDNSACRRCGTRIAMEMVDDGHTGSGPRPSYWCPTCQPG
jgi:endonuclease-8